MEKYETYRKYICKFAVLLAQSNLSKSFFNYISEECNFKKCSRERNTVLCLRMDSYLIWTMHFRSPVLVCANAPALYSVLIQKRTGTTECMGQLCQVASSPCRILESFSGDDLRQSSDSLNFLLEMFFCEGNSSLCRLFCPPCQSLSCNWAV